MITGARKRGWSGHRLSTACAAGVLFAYLVIAVVARFRGWWFVDTLGRPTATDFIDVWAAGKLALAGNPAAAYDWPAHQAMEDAAVGYRFDGYFGWHYPPTFLLAAAPLALAGYLPAWFIWVFLTAGFFVWSIYWILPSKSLPLLFLAAPTAVWCAVVGQNGFLSGGLIAGALVFLETRPVLAGVFLGLLTYKPQFGVMFPIALLAGRRWTVLISAIVTAMAFALVSVLAFGMGTWIAFARSFSTTVNGVLRVGGSGWPKIQSVYAAIHQITDDDRLAWIGQGCWMLLFAAAVATVWARPGPYKVKAAFLAVAAVAATPYVYVYDDVILLAPAALLASDGLERGWAFRDKALLAISVVLPLFFIQIGSLTTPLACLSLVLLCALRPPSEVAHRALAPSRTMA
jgi:hypothetical protein